MASRQRRHVSLGQLKVMSAIESCRTAALGGHVARCENCAHTHITYNSCRNRHCPKCQAIAAKEWLARLGKPNYFPCPTTTSSSPCQPRSATSPTRTRPSSTAYLFKAAAETLITIAADPKHLAARIGLTAVLHTWGSALTHHPHVHIVVPGGGISPDGQRWISCRPGFFLPCACSRGCFGGYSWNSSPPFMPPAACGFFGDHAHLAERRAFTAYLAPLRKTEWVVYSKRPFGGPEAVLAYLSLYTHRSPSQTAGSSRSTTPA